MKLFSIIAIGIFAAAIPVFPGQVGQNTPNGYEPGAKVLLYGDKVNVRDQASPAGKVTAQLAIGTEVAIIEKDDAKFEQNGYSENWYKVSYKENSGKSGSGYIWGGLISKTAYTGDILNDGVMDTVLFGVSGFGKESLMFKARLLQNGKLVSESPDMPGFQNVLGMGAGVEYDVLIDLQQKIGFKNPADAIHIVFQYDACDVLNGEIFLLCDGKKLYYVATLDSFGNELCSIDYKIVLPAQGKKETKITVTKDEELINEETGESELSRVTEVYVWDGKTVKKSK
ncbi:MAG: hypothetical protein A2Y33_12335 [Spirochaetes bacterium GWF1_51_8]|nr:MAG: hypothetical protein A2Y33_12335 [Spirochaetes bacterium GWF1_51_8]